MWKYALPKKVNQSSVQIFMQKALSFNNPSEANNEHLYAEVKKYQDCRYTGASWIQSSAPEAVNRIFEYDSIEAKQTVESLDVHLPGRQKEYCRGGKERESARSPKRKQN